MEIDNKKDSDTIKVPNGMKINLPFPQETLNFMKDYDALPEDVKVALRASLYSDREEEINAEESIIKEIIDLVSDCNKDDPCLTCHRTSLEAIYPLPSLYCGPDKRQNKKFCNNKRLYDLLVKLRQIQLGERPLSPFQTALNTVENNMMDRPFKVALICGAWTLKLYEEITESTLVTMGVYPSSFGQTIIVLVNTKTKKQIGELICPQITLMNLVDCIYEIFKDVARCDIVIFRSGSEGNALIDYLRQVFPSADRIKWFQCTRSSMLELAQLLYKYVIDSPTLFTSNTLYQYLLVAEVDEKMKTFKKGFHEILLTYIMTIYNIEGRDVINRPIWE